MIRPGHHRGRPQLSDAEKVPSEEEVGRALHELTRRVNAAVGSTRVLRRRDLLVFKLAALSGLRASELARLRAGDVQPSGPGVFTVSVRGGKKRASSHVDYVPLPHAIGDELYAWARNAALVNPGPLRPLFRTRDGEPIERRHVWAIVRAAFRRVGARASLSTHSLRHFYVSTLLDAGLSPIEVAKLARLRRLETLPTYAHVGAKSRALLLGIRLPKAPRRSNHGVEGPEGDDKE